MIAGKCAPLTALTLCLCLGGLAGQGAARADQSLFESPDEAVKALLEAAATQDPAALDGLFGPEGAQLSSGDPVADARAREDFVVAAQALTRIELLEDGDRATLTVGRDEWPFPIPLVREPKGWRFDTAEGIDELLDRRIGRNELTTIAVMRELVEAQYEYASGDPDGNGDQEYALKLMSSESKRDGLFWPAAAGEAESPMGRLVAEAVAEGYRPGEGAGIRPYHGYVYRLLTGQGGHAPGGSKSYLDDGKLTGGFAFLAFPAEYGSSGIMSFQVSQLGILFEKDLGEDTAALAAAIQAYDPDSSWRPVID